MAFSEEQEAQILEMMGKMGEYLSKQGEKQEDKKEPEKKDEGLLSEAKRTWKSKAIRKKTKPRLKRQLASI